MITISNKDYSGEFSINDVLKKAEEVGVCSDFDRFLGHYLRFLRRKLGVNILDLKTDRCRIPDPTHSWLSSNSKALKWLVQEGFLTKVKPVTFHYGELFQRKELHINEIYQIIQVGVDIVAFIRCKTGNRLTGAKQVSDATRIVPAEFLQIAGTPHTNYVRTKEIKSNELSLD